MRRFAKLLLSLPSYNLNYCRMNRRNTLAFSHKNGGGNFEGSKLALAIHALTKPAKGRLASFFSVMLVVLFVFTAALSLSSCSSGDEEVEDSPIPADYQSMLTAHDWEITTAAQKLGGFLIDQKEADLYCHFSPDSVFFAEGAMVNYFDYDGKVTKSQYEYSPLGGAPYHMKGEQIKIENETFTITNNDKSQASSSLILENEEWRLVLEKK